MAKRYRKRSKKYIKRRSQRGKGLASLALKFAPILTGLVGDFIGKKIRSKK